LKTPHKKCEKEREREREFEKRGRTLKDAILCEVYSLIICNANANNITRRETGSPQRSSLTHTKQRSCTRVSNSTERKHRTPQKKRKRKNEYQTIKTKTKEIYKKISMMNQYID
jgi:hypothetical protein